MTRDSNSGHPEYSDDVVSLSHTASTLKRYAGVILVSLASVALAYLVVAIAVFLLAPSQKVTSLRFRLEFKGADSGEYPNGLKFSVAEITATPVLLDVYNANQIARFTTFDHFSRSLFVLESNRELEQLTAEYQTKLADPKLTPVDRDRIEREFEARRASISKSDYSLVHTATPDVSKIPHALVPKILDDTLRTWARRAAVEKKVLDYHVPALTTNILADMQVQDSDYLIPLLLLRRRVDDIIKNIEEVREIPGADLVRTKQQAKSLEEIKLTLQELTRFRLEPLIATARATGALGPASDALRVIRAQLAYDERALAAAQGREEALRNVLGTYESTQNVPISSSTTDAEPRTRETLMPQISDTFLERIVDLANRNADREYRQKLTEEIKMAALAVVPLEAAVKYDQELIESFQAAATAGQPLSIEPHFVLLMDNVRAAINQINEIYQTASRLLNPETEMYRVLGPPVARTHRAISLVRAILWGMLILLIALPLTIAIVLIHNRIREEDTLVVSESAEPLAASRR